MYLTIAGFLNECPIKGPDRSLALSKLVAGAVAYNVRCPEDVPENATLYYRKHAQIAAMRIISAVNERVPFNTDQCMADVRLLYIGRYMQVNYPKRDCSVKEFHDSLDVAGANVNSTYCNWIDKFISAVKEELRKEK